MKYNFFVYMLAMAGVTYLIRLLPLLFVRKKIENKFILSFLHYLPYTVLAVMTVPAIFYATQNKISATIGFLAAVIFSLFEDSLIKVAMVGCASVLISELIIMFIH